MTVFKTALMALTVLLAWGCTSTKRDSASISTLDESASNQLDLIGLQGHWKLESYNIDGQSTYFGSNAQYVLSFTESDNTFGMTTDCNILGGTFYGSNDTIRFRDVSVTEMACDNMTVEESLLRIFFDSTAYAVFTCDSILYTAPNIGYAIFKKIENLHENE